MGKRLALVVRIPFCTDSSSGGNPSEPHLGECHKVSMHTQTPPPPSLTTPPSAHEPADFHLVGQQTLHTEGLAEWDASLLYIPLPNLVDHLTAEVPAKGALVAQEGSTY